MALETRLYQKLTQQLVMTPQLRQAIKILQVSRAELEQLIDQELTENPVLEELLEEPRVAEEESRTDEQYQTEQNYELEAPAQTDTTSEVTPDPNNGMNDIDWKEYLENYSNDWHGASGTSSDYDEEKRAAMENMLTRSESLTEHLIWQLRMADLDPVEESVAAMMIGNMDKNGYLTLEIEDIAFQTGQDIEIVQRALERIQSLEPHGVGARDLRECLLLQLGHAGEEGSLAAAIIRDHLDLLEGKRYDKIARELSVTIDDVSVAAVLISNLEPKPGRNYGEGDVRYITPDVFVQKVGDEYVIILNEEGLPRLRVSQFYRNVLGSDGTSDAKRYIQEKMRAAAWLIKSIQQRQRTLSLVTASIVKFQRDFLDHGVSALKPMVLKDVAMDIGMHESTVSRATANKYVHTAQGIFELKYFFTSSLRAGDGSDEFSAESVKERIREIIGKESQKNPLSDQQIAEMLGKENIDIARRTVAKYREMMAILPSSKRRQVF